MLVNAGCSKEQQTDGQVATGENAGRKAAARTLGPTITSGSGVSVKYPSYDKYDIASEARFLTTKESQPFVIAHGVGTLDEDGERRYKVNFELPGDGNQSSSLVARFRFTGQGAQIRKATLDQRWETHYIFPNEDSDLRLGIPRVETYDLVTGAMVAETKNIQLMPLDHGWHFSGQEYCYEDGKLVFVSSFVRDGATGLLISENIQKGKLPRDYHHYELVVISWPEGGLSKIDLVPVAQ